MFVVGDFVSRMLESLDAWDAVACFAGSTIGAKEVAEHERQLRQRVTPSYRLRRSVASRKAV